MNPSLDAEERTQIRISVSPHDPLIIRDGRPFGIGLKAGNRAYSLDWPYPQTIAGAVRTLIGKIKGNGSQMAKNPFSDADFLTRLKSSHVLGPFPQIDGGLYMPTPSDAIAYQGDDSKWYALSPHPLDIDEGTNMPHLALWPVAVPANQKAVKKAPFWSEESLYQWLEGSLNEDFQPSVLEKFEKDERVHIAMEHSLGRATDQMLFSTEGVVIPDIDWNGARRCSLAALVKPSGEEITLLLNDVDTLQSFGGERRLARFRTDLVPKKECPSSIREGMSKANGVRMFLGTPAVFSGGWVPGWLDPISLEGTPPSAPSSLRLRLRGACVERWRPVSGWSMEQRAEKPIRRLVPSGSVYFFQKVSGQTEDLADAWLRAVSDDEQDRRDGYGVALWGVWECDSTKGGFDR